MRAGVTSTLLNQQTSELTRTYTLTQTLTFTHTHTNFCLPNLHRSEWAEYCSNNRLPTFKLHLYLDRPAMVPSRSSTGQGNSRVNSGGRCEQHAREHAHASMCPSHTHTHIHSQISLSPECVCARRGNGTIGNYVCTASRRSIDGGSQ
eukprot:1158341-Pelagomonas_calceolata.AAC.10